MDEDAIEAELDDIADQYDRDLDEVKDIYEDKLDHIENADVIGVDEEDYPEHALRTTRSNLQSATRSGGGGPSGPVEEVPFLAIGNFGVFDSWGNDDDTVMVGVGVAAPPDTEEENRLPGLCAVIMNESAGLDIGKARDLWKWGNHIRGWFTIEKLTESFASRDRSYYIAGSEDRSKIEEADFEGSLPTEADEIREFLGENYVKEDFTLDSVVDAISMEEGEFGANWLDLRRFEGQVVDSYRRDPEDCEPGQNPFGKYTLIDDTVASPDELEEDRNIMSEDDVENGRTPGLQAFLPPEQIEYGEDSTVEVYGTVNRDGETGRITMRGAGVAPIIPFPREEEGGGGDHEDVQKEDL